MRGDYQIECADWEAYVLLDSGDGRRLERWGDITLIRPEPKAWWQPRRHDLWKTARAEVSRRGTWRVMDDGVPRSWTIPYGNLTLEARMTDMSKHVGVFPEQQPHWRWIFERLERHRGSRVLNLFGYTGVASLIAASCGAEVTHVDASKPSISWARENQRRSGLEDAPIRWLLDDAFRFVAREVRRGRTYDAIFLDPPSFGRGPRGEVWKVEEHIVSFLQSLAGLLNSKKAMVVLTMYNLNASALMLGNLVADGLTGGELEFGELCLREDNDGRRLPLSLFCRWSKNW